MTKQRTSNQYKLIPVFTRKDNGDLVTLWRGRLGSGLETGPDMARMIRRWASDPAAVILTNITFRYW